MKVSVFAVIFSIFIAQGCCTILASTGYILSQPTVRNFLIRSGLGTMLNRKANSLYDASNFRYATDQGTDIRKAEMGSYDIVEIDPNKKVESDPSRSGLAVKNEEDRKYSERLFRVLNDMDRNGCVSRLLCEIAADPKSFGLMGLKIHHYLKSVPPVTWNSATFPYLEAFQSGLASKDACNQHYTTCNYDLRRVMKFLWLFLKPINLKTGSRF